MPSQLDLRPRRPPLLRRQPFLSTIPEEPVSAPPPRPPPAPRLWAPAPQRPRPAAPPPPPAADRLRRDALQAAQRLAAAERAERERAPEAIGRAFLDYQRRACPPPLLGASQGGATGRRPGG